MTNRSGSIVEGLPGFLKESLDFFKQKESLEVSPEPEVVPVDLFGSLSLEKTPITPSGPQIAVAAPWNLAPALVIPPMVGPHPVAPSFELPVTGTTPPPVGNQFPGPLEESKDRPKKEAPDQDLPMHPGFPPPPLFGNFNVPPMMHPQDQGGLWNQPVHIHQYRHPHPFLQNSNMMFQQQSMPQFNLGQPPLVQPPRLQVSQLNNRRMANTHRKNGHRRKGDDAAKYANAELEDFVGQIYTLCKDQHGCRFLQRQIDAANKNVATTMIFNEIYLKIVELMTDPFGNYLIQKLFEAVTPDQRLILVKNAAPEFVRIALDPHGTRALQKLVECIDTSDDSEEAAIVVDLLSQHVVSLLRDLNGNHVVQKCLQKLLAPRNQFIYDAALDHCIEIATHRHGCCVLQRCLDHGSQEQRNQLSLKVACNTTKLSLDPFGNYVVQYVLARGDDSLIVTILAEIKLNIVTLSLHKFGSNVIEKSLRILSMTAVLVDELLKNAHRFGDLLNDAYGNYVLQTSMDVALASDLQRLLAALLPLLPQIKNTPHGRRIMTKIQSIM